MSRSHGSRHAKDHATHGPGARAAGPTRTAHASGSAGTLHASEPAPPRWWRWSLLALFVAALAWRLFALARLAHGPLLTQLSADADMYWRWAGGIRAGLWVPAQPFFLAPLYPYALALVRSIVGDSIARVAIVQCVLGAASVALVADATRRVATPRAGLCVGLALAGYGMLVAFDLLILGESLLLFLGCTVLWLLVRAGRPRPLVLGALVGLMALGRPLFMLLLVPCGLLVARRTAPRRLRALAALVLVPVALMALTAFHQWRAGAGWTPVTYSGGYNLFIGNGPYANGTYVPFADAWNTTEPYGPGGTEGDGRAYLSRMLGRTLTPAESERYWRGATLDHVRTHPAQSARLMLRKLGLLFDHAEASQIIDTATYDRAAGPFGWPLGWEFALFGVAGLLGAVVAWRRGATARLLVLWLVLLTFGSAAFFVVDRYRIHLVPALAILAGLGVEAAIAAWRERRWRDVTAMAVVAAAAAGVVFAPLIPDDPAHERWSYAITMGDAWLAQGDARRALDTYAPAVALERSGVLRGAATVTGRFARGGMYENAGAAHAMVGEDAQALECLATAARLVPESPSTQTRYADQLALVGRIEEARALYGTTGVPARQVADRMVRDAVEREREGDHAATLRDLQAAAGLAPDFEPAVVALVRLQIMSGALDAAAARLQAAAAGGMDANVVRAHRAWLQAARGDTTDARRTLESIPATVRAGDARVAATLELMRRRTGWSAGRE